MTEHYCSQCGEDTRESCSHCDQHVRTYLMLLCDQCADETGEPCNTPACASYGRVGPSMAAAIEMDRDDARMYRKFDEHDEEAA